MALSHPAEEATDRAQDNPNTDATESFLRQRDRSELCYALAEVSDAFDADEDAVHDPDDNGTLTKDELIALVQYAGENEGDGDEGDEDEGDEDGE